MKVFPHNFNPSSNSGPNKFTRDLFSSLISYRGFEITNQDQADVEFCLIQQAVQKKKPMVLRLDGIYFNSEQDYENQNAPIKASYENADAVIFQSNFNKALISACNKPLHPGSSDCGTFDNPAALPLYPKESTCVLSDVTISAPTLNVEWWLLCAIVSAIVIHIVSQLGLLIFFIYSLNFVYKKFC